ncbi:DUF5686 family protein [Tenacibaculum maritimum]|uniref:DUF5686 family protein n=1 Tax=Tenacibaculum maritimum TaxID=107401 RepID=UPI003877422A
MKIKFAILFLFVTIGLQAQLTIKGKVVDAQKVPMPFVNVYIQGSSNGTTTDDDGRFSFTAKKNRGTLEISFIGFQTQTIKVNPKTKFLNIVLKEGDNQLEEVLIVAKPKVRLKKKENPAYKILKEIWKRKKKNGLKLVNHYQYQKHVSTEIGLNNLDTTFLKTLFKEQYNSTINEIKYDSDGINYYIPIYINEKVTNFYGNNKTKTIREDVEAEREEGLSAQGFVFDRISNTFQDINIYKNSFQLLNKSFESPISTNGFATYDYLLYDSIVENNKKLYNIYFFPLRNGDLAFEGNFWVDDKSYAINTLKMKVNKGINLNFVRGLTFEREFEFKNDSIYLPKRNAYEGDFTFVDKNESNKGLTVKKTERFSAYLLGRPLPNEFYTQKITKIRPNQFSKEQVYWEKHEDEADKTTYKLIQSVKKKRKIKKLTGLINTLSSGYVRIGNTVQVGPFWTAFANNEVEGFRARLGFRTFKSIHDRFRLTSYAAYGFKDKKIKFGAEARYLLSYKPRIAVGVAYQDDIEQLGSTLLNTSQLLGRSFGSTALLSRGNNYFLSEVKKIAGNFDYRIMENLHVGINGSRATITSAAPPEKFSMAYSLDGGKTIQTGLTDVASDIYISYTPGRFVYGLGVAQRFGRNIFPTLVLNYRHGYKGPFHGSFDYDKLQFLYSQPILLGKLGLLDATIEGGKTFGTVPIGLLSPIPANQSFSLVRNTFALMNYYDFVTDAYVATHLEHHFNGFILNRIPLLKKLKLRSLVSFRAAYGTISKSNKEINDGYSSINHNAPSNKLYYEYSVGVENIGYGNLRFLRIDAIWRSNYTPPTNSIAIPTPKFAVRIAINPGL